MLSLCMLLYMLSLQPQNLSQLINSYVTSLYMYEYFLSVQDKGYLMQLRPYWSVFRSLQSKSRVVSVAYCGFLLCSTLLLLTHSIRVKHKLSIYASTLTFNYRHVTLESCKPKKVRTNIFHTSSFRNPIKAKQINKSSPQSTGKLFSS